MATGPYFNFEHMNLVPRMCMVDSRSKCDTSVKFGAHTFKLPIVPANMECVINEELAERLATAGYFYVLHRFDVNVVEFARRMRAAGLIVSISVGVNEDSYELLRTLKAADLVPDYITIDIAHGHAIKMQRMIHWIKYDLGHNLAPEKVPFIIAGNVSTAAAVTDLGDWGADAIKVGIGPGSACTTYNVTGFGSRGAQPPIIELCAAAARQRLYTTPTGETRRTRIIADGGIKEPGDIAKSLVLGADMVMVGGMFSGLADSPGNLVVGPDGREYKEFWGSASAHAFGKSGRVEGTKKLIPLNHKTVLEEMKYLEECLQSAISYGGGVDVDDLRKVDYFVRRT